MNEFETLRADDVLRCGGNNIQHDDFVLGSSLEPTQYVAKPSPTQQISNPTTRKTAKSSRFHYGSKNLTDSSKFLSALPSRDSVSTCPSS